VDRRGAGGARGRRVRPRGAGRVLEPLTFGWAGPLTFGWAGPLTFGPGGQVLMVDAHEPVGNGARVPRGPLREPLLAGGRLAPRLAAGVHLIVLHGAAGRAALPPAAAALLAAARGARPPVPVVLSRLAPTELMVLPGARGGARARVAAAPGALAGCAVVALAGLARPAGFFAAVRALGPAVVREPPPRPPRTKWTRRVPHPVLIGHAASLSQVRELHFPDHHPFSPRDLAWVAASARALVAGAPQDAAGEAGEAGAAGGGARVCDVLGGSAGKGGHVTAEGAGRPAVVVTTEKDYARSGDALARALAGSGGVACLEPLPVALAVLRGEMTLEPLPDALERAAGDDLLWPVFARLRGLP
jgi:hypothetical protein